MEGRHRLDAVLKLVPLAAVFGDPEVLVYERLGGRPAEAQYDLWFNRLHLALEVGVAGFDLPGPRRAVLHPPAFLHGRPALDGVGQVDVLARQVHRREYLVEKLAGSPGEREPRRVLVL